MKLFESHDVGGMSIPNRVMVPAMVTRLSAKDGHVSALVQRVHDASGSKIVPQLIHFRKVACSGWRQTVDMLSLEEIDRTVEQFGTAYVSLSVEGKFEDAVHEPGHVPYLYTGFSDDRCMPGHCYPMGLLADPQRICSIQRRRHPELS